MLQSALREAVGMKMIPHNPAAERSRLGRWFEYTSHCTGVVIGGRVVSETVR